ncbi:ACT domain-containing protein [Peptoniphilus catoniae]|uniref:ACT domain-containing protein n=1 Tax=Peptoniphilus catoniae TaxID=1660341 RepID=UPI0010FD7C87|nr:ACT domain-containing protein [Peptoniphilus catoniae]
MKAVITFIGNDKIGIVHKATEILVKYHLNIVDINQTIMDDYFTMIMIVDISESTVEFSEIVRAFTELGEEIGMYIKVQHEDIFKAMHQI